MKLWTGNSFTDELDFAGHQRRPTLNCDRAADEHIHCLAAVESLIRRNITLCLAPQVLIEFWVVATRPASVNGFGWEVTQAADALHHLRGIFPLLTDEPALFDAWLAIVRLGVHGKRAHDARLVAFMQVHGIGEILTLNVADFKGFPIKPLHPGLVGSI